MPTKKAVLNGTETIWGGFLIDLDVQDTLSLFKRAHITNYGDDRETVHEAWQECRTIVTNNEKDFIHFIPEHSKRDSGKKCQDCWGLLIVPGNEITRSRLIPKVKNGVKLGGSLIPWAALAYANLCISLHVDGTIGVRRFRRCVRCSKDDPIESEWYKALPEIAHRRARGKKV